MSEPGRSLGVLVVDDSAVARRLLVHILNSIPGITTYSSCGGHRNHSLGQVAAGTFYVELAISSGRVGTAPSS